MGQIIKSLASVCRHYYSRNFYSILMKFYTEVMAQKVRTNSLGGSKSDDASLFCPNFLPGSAFSMGSVDQL